MRVVASRENDSYRGHGLRIGTIVEVKPNPGKGGWTAYAWIATDGTEIAGERGPAMFFAEELAPL